MADIKTADDQELNEDGTPKIKPDDGGEDGDQPSKKTDKDTDDDSEDGSDKDDDDDGGDQADSNKDDDEDIDTPEIPVRRSAASHIIKRKSETIEKLRKKEEEEEEEEEKGDIDGADAKSAVAKEVKKQINPIVESLGAKADTDELNELFISDPASKKYEKRIKAYMNHPSWKQVPSLAIFRHLAFGDAQAIGAHKKKIADTEAGHTTGGGRSIRPTNIKEGDVPSVEEMDNMSDEEFETLQHKARIGKFLKPE